ncbi:MAG: hypothetical protein EBR82_63040 [Caulobacteraceae bacterium]|nr:hypothetical protein [Caulobacteraceae bacterium]
MTIEQIVCVMFGSILQAIVFALGVAVGVSLSKRKESHDNSDEAAQGRRCDDGPRAVARGVERRCGGGCNPRTEADPHQRASARWPHHSEFPTWEPGKLAALPRIPCDQFARAVRSVVYATDNESSRFALGAVQIEVADGECTFAASDGRRLAVAIVEFDQALDTTQTLVPAKALQQMEFAAARHKGDGTAVQLEASDSEIVATFDGTTITARLIEGKFPKWRDVFPDRDATEHEVEINALWSATRAAAIVTTEQSKGVDYTFSAKGLTLEGQSSESGESKVECEIVTAGKAGKVKLDPRFVCDACKALSTLDGEPTVRISTDGSGDAVVLTYGEDDEYRSVIMPLDPAG